MNKQEKIESLYLITKKIAYISKYNKKSTASNYFKGLVKLKIETLKELESELPKEKLSIIENDIVAIENKSNFK